MLRILKALGVASLVALFAAGCVVLVLYYEPTERRAKQEAKDQSETQAVNILASERVAYYTEVLAIFTAILSGFGLAQIYFLNSSDKTASINAEAAKTSADATKLLAGADRAWMVFDRIDFGDLSNVRLNKVLHETGLGVFIHWKNKGRSPAISAKVYAAHHVQSIEDLSIPVFSVSLR